MQVTLGSCVERCLAVMESFGRLVGSLPDQLDLTLTPLLPEDLPPIVRCGDRSVAEDATSRLNVREVTVQMTS